MRNNLFILILFSFLFSSAYAQREANNWYFGQYAAIEFSTGSPLPLTNSMMNAWNGCATISDTTGNLLFYTNGEVVFNRYHQQMPNGSGLLGGNGTQNCIIVPYPGNQERYYIFTVGTEEAYPPYPCVGLYYSIVNMGLDGGRGNIEPFFKNMPLPGSDKATYKITAVRHQNNTDVWVIVRNLSAPANEYHSYLVTRAGINSIPVRSPCINNVDATTSGAGRGQMKISPDGKLIFSAIYGLPCNEIGSFNVITGEINIWFTFYPNIINSEIHGVEFSHDTKFLYFTTYYSSIYNRLLQYDLSLLPDESSFLSSMKIIAEPAGVARDLQAGPYGKIYIARYNKEYLGVINNPELEGISCNYDSVGVYLGGQRSGNGLPQFIQSYFLRFQYTGHCPGAPTHFTSNFNPVPDSIHWDFGDPGSGASNYSNDLNPQHIYTVGGDYTVTVYVRFPDGHTEEATREVNVSELPHPYPGNDTIVCEGAPVTLQATTGYESYLWNTLEANISITVADTGYYWVDAINSEGCTGRDTVHVAWQPSVYLDISQAEISNTTCNNSTGAIRGILVSPAAIIKWRDGSGNLVGSEIDITGLPVGNYFLTIIDTTGCITEVLPAFTINNTDSDLIIQDAVPSDASCGQANGSVVIKTSVFSDLLQYSIDDGNTWHDNLGSFMNVPPGPYFVRVMDSEDCVAVYANNPVVVEDNEGPVVNPPVTIPATGTNADGTIAITATGNGDLNYSIDNGGSFQLNNGLFTGLIAGDYTCVVIDANGCDTTFSVTVLSVAGFRLSAIAGQNAACKGETSTLPVYVGNFNGIKTFRASLSFNPSAIDCEGYVNVNPALEDLLSVDLFPSTGEILITWTGLVPVVLPDTSQVLELVFKTKEPGGALLNWNQAPSDTWFIDHLGNLIPVDYTIGQMQVHNPPVLSATDDKVCQGDFLFLTTNTSVPGIYNYEWDLPGGGTATGSSQFIMSASPSNAGLYTIRITDNYNCADTTSMQLEVVPFPIAGFSSDTIPFEQQFTLEATPGYFSYQWSNGDTTYFITGTEEGNYSVIIQTQEGCTTIDSAYLKDVYMPFYFMIPNAFTPNGDGLNDAFRPVVDYERVRMFGMAVYNHWGQLIFETTNTAEGWDGKDAPAGVYSWVISYSDMVGKVSKLMGSVMLVR